MELRAKKRQRCQTHETERAGDMWDHTAVTADSKLVVSLVGKRSKSRRMLWCMRLSDSNGVILAVKELHLVPQ